MDQRLKHIVDNFDKMKIGPDEPFKFHCTQCGKCCIDREDILLNPFDLYRASKELKMTPDKFVEQYCETYLGQDSKMPIVRLRPRGSIKRCPLLKDRKCSIHNVKPTVCAMFPIGRVVQMEASQKKAKPVTADQIQFIFTNPGCGDNAETHTVREWFGQFGIPIKDEFFLRWQSAICILSPLLRRCIEQFSEETADKVITLTYIKLYLDYDMNKEFMPQFISNTSFIDKLMKLMPDKSKGGVTNGRSALQLPNCT